MATGMHRASTSTEHLKMFGEFVVKNYRIVDHNCGNENELQELEGRSWSGAKVRLNKHYIEAGFRIVTGLVEPHFMAGFSGGKKSNMPRIGFPRWCSEVSRIYLFKPSQCFERNVLENNPCHMENTSIARLCPPDYAINVVLDNNKKINAIVSGELFASHQKTDGVCKRGMLPCCISSSRSYHNFQWWLSA